MIDIEALKKLKECCDFLNDNLTFNNLPLVYEVATNRYGSVVLAASATILLSCTKEGKHGKSTQ